MQQTKICIVSTYSNTETSHAMSTVVIWSRVVHIVSRCQVSRFQSPRSDAMYKPKGIYTRPVHPAELVVAPQ